MADLSMVGPVIPLLAAPPPPNTNSASISSGVQYLSWQPNPNPNPNDITRRQQPLFPMLDATTSTGIFPGHHGNHMVIVPSSSTNAPTSATCQDCGNHAKKDCAYRRCRTCCRSRRFDCPTHVKSTWVPAARRRERQQLATALPASGSKKPRLLVASNSNSHTSTSNNTPRSVDTSSSNQDGGSLLWHVRAPAEFRCVRVTSIDDGEDEYAYQAMVKIGGHVYKGLLYDQGMGDAADNNSSGGQKFKNSCSGNPIVPSLSGLHLGGAGDIGSASSAMLVGVPPDVYVSSGGGSVAVGGTAFGNTIN